MGKKCSFCGKKAITGRNINRRGLAKKKGGVGRKITSSNKRKFYPNLQSKNVIIEGKRKTVLVCTKCIKAGKLNNFQKISSKNN